ncbi:MAG: phytanoyl-CoA dioxygenase family protein [Phycisphaeraceae bacterium]
MSTTHTTAHAAGLSVDQFAAYQGDGYHIARGLLRPAEIAEIRDYFERIAEKGEPIAKHWEPDTSVEGAKDPLKRYPRIMQPHRFSELAKRYLLDARVGAVLTALLEEEPIACQSMYYFKPPGGRGQALHQDNFYLRVSPHTCIAAWVAIDPSFPANGGLHICPGTHRLEVACPEQADLSKSFSPHYVKPPEGHEPIPARLEPGDVLFFNGSVIHGSDPNTSNQWRRSFICHYMPWRGREIAESYKPLLRFTGETVERDTAEGGGPCGADIEFIRD